MVAVRPEDQPRTREQVVRENRNEANSQAQARIHEITVTDLGAENLERLLDTKVFYSGKISRAPGAE